jgi:puromycin-sensitive aminopeptidase
VAEGGATTDPEDPYRLPRAVTPSRYDLSIQPDLGAGTFTGSEDVAVDVHDPVGVVVLNILELTVDGGWLIDPDGRRLEIGEVEVDERLQRVTLGLSGEASPGPWTLHLDFHGVLNDKLRGFYRSTYTEEDGLEHVIATTQFEAADARRAFPCWDEPDLKAVFGITLVVPGALAAISNGPEIEREPLVDGLVRVRFADTMVMSTYLVAFVVGRLELTDPADADGVPVRVAHVPGKGHLTGFALEAAVFSLRFFREYYGIPYPDAKVDMIALPDFAQGAMENTGCITYRESLLLADPAHATQPELENIADVVAHELAHQWFGNLVTMRWWNGIWLNEAFATFMALVTTDAMRPDWQRWSAFARHATAAKEVDALHSTRAIEYPVHSPDDTAGMFDVLTYQKGAAILRMLEQYLGPESFRDGIRHYLAAHEYGNTETHDLWDDIEAATGEPVRRIMDQWIWQGGYPILDVRVAADRIRIDQHRFLADGAEDPTVWDVPLRVRGLDGDERSVLVVPEGLVLSGPEAAPVVANAGAASFVRVHYDEGLRERLTGRLRDLTPLERYGLVDDLWAAVGAGAASASEYVRFAERFADEDDLSVWQALLQGLGWCDRFLDGDAREGLRRFVRRLVAPSLDRLGWEASADDADLTRALRGALLQGLGVLGADPNAQAAAREFEAEARAGKDVDAALAAASVTVLARTGTLEDFERFEEMSEAAPTPQEQLRYLYALPQFRGEPEMDRTLTAALDGRIRTQNAPFLLALATVNREQGARAWDFIKEHWGELYERLPASLIIRMADGVRFLTRTDQVADAAAFFAEHPIPQSEKGLAQTLERQRVAAALRERAGPELTAFFTS